MRKTERNRDNETEKKLTHRDRVRKIEVERQRQGEVDVEKYKEGLANTEGEAERDSVAEK